MHEAQKNELAEELRAMFDEKGLSVNASRFAIYVPSRLSDGTDIDPDRHRVLVDVAKRFLCDKLGGLTSYEAKGAWVESETGRLHEEYVMVLESYCPLSKLVHSAKDLRHFANALAIEFGQAAMACVVDGEMVFFEPTGRYREIHKWIATEASLDARKPDSVVWKHVLEPLKAAGIKSVFGEIA